MKPCVNSKMHKQTANQLLRRAFAWMGGYDGEKKFVTIEFIGGFEYFNTRPYHNYETWGYGYRVTDGTNTHKSECLECALEKLLEV